MHQTIEGQLDRRKLFRRRAWDAAIILFFLWLGCGALLFGIALVMLVEHVPLWAGAVLGVFFLWGLAFSLASAWLRVYNKWRRAVTWFRCEEDVLQYRVWWKHETYQLPLKQIAWVLPKAPLDAPGQLGNVVSICLASGEWIYLQSDLLTEVRRLCERLMPVATENRIARSQADAKSMPRAVDQQHELWPRIAPHLEEGETVYWIGTSLSDRLMQTWTMTYFSIPFFLLVGSLLAYGFIEDAFADPAMVFSAGGVIALLVIVICFALAIAQLRKRILRRQPVRRSVFAVTSRRAMVVDGVEWGEKRLRSLGADAPTILDTGPIDGLLLSTESRPGRFHRAVDQRKRCDGIS